MSAPSTVFMPIIYGLPHLGDGLVGRAKELDALAGKRTDKSSMTVIQGPSGVGKSDLLKAYLQAHADVKNRLWFDASTVEGLNSQYLDLYNKIWLPTYGDAEESVIRGHVTNGLANLIGPTILVYDHATTHRELYPFLPGGGHELQILVSSSQLWPDADCLPPLAPLSGRDPVLSRDEVLKGLKPIECTILIAAVEGGKKRKDLRALLPAGAMASCDFDDVIAELNGRGMIVISCDQHQMVTVNSPYRQALAPIISEDPSVVDDASDTAPRPR